MKKCKLTKQRNHPRIIRELIITDKDVRRERKRENSIFGYRNKQAGAKMQWVRYIAVNY